MLSALTVRRSLTMMLIRSRRSSSRLPRLQALGVQDAADVRVHALERRLAPIDEEQARVGVLGPDPAGGAERLSAPARRGECRGLERAAPGLDAERLAQTQALRPACDHPAGGDQRHGRGRDQPLPVARSLAIQQPHDSRRRCQADPEEEEGSGAARGLPGSRHDAQRQRPEVGERRQHENDEHGVTAPASPRHPQPGEHARRENGHREDRDDPLADRCLLDSARRAEQRARIRTRA